MFRFSSIKGMELNRLWGIFMIRMENIGILNWFYLFMRRKKLLKEKVMLFMMEKKFVMILNI